MEKWYSNISWHNRAWTGVLQLERSLTSQGKWFEVWLKRKIFSFPGRFFSTIRNKKHIYHLGKYTMSVLLSYVFSSLILVTEAIACKANKLFFFFFWCVVFFVCVWSLLAQKAKPLFPTMGMVQAETFRSPSWADRASQGSRAVHITWSCLQWQPLPEGFGLPPLPPGKNWLFCACCVTLDYSLIALPKEVQMSHSLLLLPCHCPCGKRWQHQG